MSRKREKAIQRAADLEAIKKNPELRFGLFSALDIKRAVIVTPRVTVTAQASLVPDPAEGYYGAAEGRGKP